jgi:hypothetical protein
MKTTLNRRADLDLIFRSLYSDPNRSSFSFSPNVSYFFQSNPQASPGDIIRRQSMPIAINEDNLSPTDTHSSYQQLLSASYPLDVDQSTRGVVHVALQEDSQKGVEKKEG